MTPKYLENQKHKKQKQKKTKTKIINTLND